jgi:hypothetical protein
VISLILAIIIFCFISALLLVIIIRELVKKHAHIWLPSYLADSLKGKPTLPKNQPVHIMFAIVDHFEPLWNNPTPEQEQERVNAWIKGYPQAMDGHVDGDGVCPQYTWFYPFDEYRAWHMEELSKLCSRGYGEVELHLHHDNDTSQGLREKMENAKRVFSEHGALITSGDNPQSVYGFIHGNWSLDNSRKDGRWCGVNNELRILSETGCYADFTMPSAPSDTQTRKINSIYYALDDPEMPKSHDTGTDVEVNREPSGDLMIIQGPLCFNWKRKKFFILPRIENGNITADNPPTPERVDLWIRQHIHVKGRPDWIFVKVYTHGAQDRNYRGLLGNDGYLNKLYSYLEDRYNDGKRYKLHYVTAREMYNIIKAAEAGEKGDLNSYRDYMIQTYINSSP